jgi:CubicO group peptidase (beta-lactamase class C family)
MNPKKRIFRILLFLGTFISLFFVPWKLVYAWLLPLPKSIGKQTEQAIDLGFDGVLVYVNQGNKEPEFYSAGWHNKEKQLPAKPEALFKIASISKLYTAVALTKLCEKKLVSLDSPITHYLPDLKDRIQYADQITIEMLVKHRSGIPNYTDTKDYWSSPKENNQENLELILDQPANFSPNKNYEYCNTNYLLLSMIMDKVLGYPHYQFIQKEILDRLDLKNTFSSVKKVNPERMMSGYHVGYPYDLKSDDLGMVASAEDVGLFLQALNNGSLFDGNEQKTYSSIYKYEHQGWVPGYQSTAKYHKEIDAVVVLFTSTTDEKLYNWNLADIEYNRIIKILSKR